MTSVSESESETLKPWSLLQRKVKTSIFPSSKNLQPKKQGSANAAQHHEKPIRRAENTNEYKERYKSR